MSYVWLKPIGGLHGHEMTFFEELSLLPLLYMKFCITMEGHTTFHIHFTMPWPTCIL